MLNKAALNFLFDCLAFLFLIAMLLTGFILWWPLPGGTNKDKLLWSLSRHEWGDIHTWLSFALCAVLAVHLIQHWKWIVTMIRKRIPSKQTSDKQWAIILIIALMIFLGLFFALATTQVKKVPDTCALNFIEDLIINSAVAEEQDASAIKLLDDKCIKCHGVEKTAGGVDLKNRSELGKGDSPWIVKFKSSESRLIKLLEDPPANMKRRDKHLLSPEKISLIKKWIDTGAD